MSLTFRSSIPERVQIVVTDTDGSRRVATLERDPNNQRKWTGSVDHPGGQRFRVDTFDPDSSTALGKLAEAFVSREIDYRQSKARGHRPEPKRPDFNQRVPDSGDYAPIVRDQRDNRT